MSLGAITTNPAECRTIMQYEIQGFAAISTKFNKDALQTDMTAPVLKISQFD
jgi:hypothetical protein